jgi:hypothetical protein
MANTTNFGWETPDDTDLVKDGAAAIRTLGSAIDTSLVDLKGGTTGQILSKTTNTDMDFTWITNDVGDITEVAAGTGISGGGTTGSVTITNDMATTITASGDIVVGTGSGTYDNLPIGTTGQVLTADTTVSPYKVKWATAAGGSYAGVRVKKTANQSIANATETVLTFDDETFDTDGYHSNVTNSGRLTVPAGKAGYYNIYFCIQWDVNATGDREVSLYINGTSTGLCGSNQAGDATIYTFLTGSTTYYLAEGDYVQLTGYQDRGGALNATNSPRVSFGMDKVG